MSKHDPKWKVRVQDGMWAASVRLLDQGGTTLVLDVFSKRLTTIDNRKIVCWAMSENMLTGRIVPLDATNLEDAQREAIHLAFERLGDLKHAVGMLMGES